jgi:hypothetical protein
MKHHGISLLLVGNGLDRFLLCFHVKVSLAMLKKLSHLLQALN